MLPFEIINNKLTFFTDVDTILNRIAKQKNESRDKIDSQIMNLAFEFNNCQAAAIDGKRIKNEILFYYTQHDIILYVPSDSCVSCEGYLHYRKIAPKYFYYKDRSNLNW